MPARPVSQCALPICIIPPPPAPPIPLPTHSLCKELAAYIHVAFPDRRKRTCVPLARSLRRTRRAKGLADTRDSDAWSDGLWHSLGTSQRGTLLSLLQDRACCSTRDLILGRTHALEISSFFLPISFLKNKNKALYTICEMAFQVRVQAPSGGQNAHSARAHSVTLHSPHTSAHCARGHHPTILGRYLGRQTSDAAARDEGGKGPTSTSAGARLGGHGEAEPCALPLPLPPARRPPAARRPHGRRDQLAGVKAAARKTAGMRPSRSAHFLLLLLRCQHDLATAAS